MRSDKYSRIFHKHINISLFYWTRSQSIPEFVLVNDSEETKKKLGLLDRVIGRSYDTYQNKVLEIWVSFFFLTILI